VAKEKRRRREEKRREEEEKRDQQQQQQRQTMAFCVQDNNEPAGDGQHLESVYWQGTDE